MPYLVEAADGTILTAAEHTYARAESTARLYVSEKRVETRVLEWQETQHGPKSRELTCGIGVSVPAQAMGARSSALA